MLLVCFDSLDETVFMTVLDNLFDQYTMRSNGYEALYKFMICLAIKKNEYLSMIIRICILNLDNRSMPAERKMDYLTFSCHCLKVLKTNNATVISKYYDAILDKLFPETVLQDDSSILVEYHIMRLMSTVAISESEKIRERYVQLHITLIESGKLDFEEILLCDSLLCVIKLVKQIVIVYLDTSVFEANFEYRALGAFH
jgi:hypothetical protein